MNSKIIELASNLAYNKLIKDLSDLYREDKLTNKDGEYANEEIQEQFDNNYDYFYNEISKVFKEPKVYLVNNPTDKESPTSTKFDINSFFKKAEKEGTIFSLKGFEKAFNGDNGEINQFTDYIIID